MPFKWCVLQMVCVQMVRVQMVYVAKSCNFCERFRNTLVTPSDCRLLAGTRLTTIIEFEKIKADLFNSFANEKWLEIKNTSLLEVSLILISPNLKNSLEHVLINFFFYQKTAIWRRCWRSRMFGQRVHSDEFGLRQAALRGQSGLARKEPLQNDAKLLAKGPLVRDSEQAAYHNLLVHPRFRGGHSGSQQTWIQFAALVAKEFLVNTL